MIAKNPDERCQTCQEIIKHLGPSTVELSLDDIKSQAISVKPEKKPSNISQQVTMQSATVDTVVPKTRTKKSNKAVWAVMALAAAVGVGAIGIHEGFIPNPFKQDEYQAMTLLGDDSDNMQLADVKLKSTEELAQISNDMNAQLSQNNSADPVSASNESSQSIADPTHASGQTPQNTLAVEQMQASTNNKAVTSQSSNDGNMSPADLANATGQTPQNTSVSEQPQVFNNNAMNAAETQPPADANIIAAVDHSKAQVNQTAEAFIEKQTKPVIRKPKVVKKDKGIAVLVFGDPAVANPIEKILEAELKRDNIKVLNEQFVPGLSQVMAQGVDLAAIKEKLDAYGGEAMIIANVNHVGQQTLEYYGRQSLLNNAQLDVDSYDLATGDSIGTGYGAELSYTSLNATENAQEAVMGFVDRLKQDIKKRK
jgi:hypothetical protein